MSDLTERLAAKLHPWLTHFTGGRYVREALVPDLLPLLLSEPELVAGLPDAVRRELLRQLIGEPDLFWSQSNNEVGLPSVSEAADFTEMQAGDVEEFDVAKTLGKRWIAMLPTDFERDDGYVDGIGWLDGEAVLFDTEAEADTALADRKAKLLAPEVPR